MEQDAVAGQREASWYTAFTTFDFDGSGAISGVDVRAALTMCADLRGRDYRDDELRWALRQAGVRGGMGAAIQFPQFSAAAEALRRRHATRTDASQRTPPSMTPPPPASADRQVSPARAEPAAAMRQPPPPRQPSPHESAYDLLPSTSTAAQEVPRRRPSGVVGGEPRPLPEVMLPGPLFTPGESRTVAPHRRRPAPGEPLVKVVFPSPGRLGLAGTQDDVAPATFAANPEPPLPSPADPADAPGVPVALHGAAQADTFAGWPSVGTNTVAVTAMPPPAAAVEADVPAVSFIAMPAPTVAPPAADPPAAAPPAADPPTVAPADPPTVAPADPPTVAPADPPTVAPAADPPDDGVAAHTMDAPPPAAAPVSAHAPPPPHAAPRDGRKDADVRAGCGSFCYSAHSSASSAPAAGAARAGPATAHLRKVRVTTDALQLRRLVEANPAFPGWGPSYEKRLGCCAVVLRHLPARRAVGLWFDDGGHVWFPAEAVADVSVLSALPASSRAAAAQSTQPAAAGADSSPSSPDRDEYEIMEEANDVPMSVPGAGVPELLDQPTQASASVAGAARAPGTDATSLPSAGARPHGANRWGPPPRGYYRFPDVPRYDISELDAIYPLGQRKCDVREEEMRVVFELFDSSRSGEIKRSELRTMLRALGYSIPAAEVDSLLATLGKLPAGVMGEAEFFALVKEVSRRHRRDKTPGGAPLQARQPAGVGAVGVRKPVSTQELRSLFFLFDEPTQRGRLTRQQLAVCLNAVGLSDGPEVDVFLEVDQALHDPHRKPEEATIGLEAFLRLVRQLQANAYARSAD